IAFYRPAPPVRVESRRRTGRVIRQEAIMRPANAITAISLIIGIVASATATPPDATFMYQGRLNENGIPVNRDVGMTFQLWNAATGGSARGHTVVCDGGSGNFPPVTVTNGLFTVPINFGTSVLSQYEALWIAIAVEGQPLSPRQPLTAVPYAVATRGI